MADRFTYDEMAEQFEAIVERAERAELELSAWRDLGRQFAEAAERDGLTVAASEMLRACRERLG